MSEKFIITSDVRVTAPFGTAAAQQFCKLVHRKFGLMVEYTEEAAEIQIKREIMPPEAFRLLISKTGAEITAGDMQGEMYGLVALFQRMKEEDGTVFAEATDCSEAPYKEIRGVHLMPPAPCEIEEFKTLLDVLSMLRLNTVIIEVGGSMELTRHPRVNEAWQMFCRILQEEFPGGPQNMQWAYKYWKDSPHTLNAGGRILTKAQMREIVEYAKKLGMNVIPEIQALSHVYYLTLAYRDIAEDPLDVFPDTYCPSNEKSYEIYFDVAEEIIEVFEPRMVSIGHDEVRSMGECEKCRGKSGHELLAYEINRLYTFYKEKNIRICMWAEKLMEPTKFGSRKLGGASIEREDEFGRKWHMPATYKAIDKIPQDILMIDWLHMMTPKSQEDFVARNMDVIYGNVHGPLFGGWPERIRQAKGAIVSTWCPPTEKALARDGLLLDIVYTAEMLWHSGYDDSKYDVFLQNAFRTLEDVRCIFGQRRATAFGDASLLYRGDGEDIFDGTGAVSASGEAEKLLHRFGRMGGVPIKGEHLHIVADKEAKELIFVSAYRKPEAYYPSYNWMVVPGYADGQYEGCYESVTLPRWNGASFAVIYTDGTIEMVNMTYGVCTADLHMNWTRKAETSSANVSEIDMVDKADAKKRDGFAAYSVDDRWQYAVAYKASPAKNGEETVYVYRWENPHPEKRIKEIYGMNTTRDKEQALLLYAIAYM
ncbi:MAG: family 20 glycosylhydrolase [Clostridia bacterium]|nr:family 20 glycosylhydrolase [Clostridia bacterium]